MKPKVLFVSYTAEVVGPTKSLMLLLQHLREDHEVSVLLPGLGGFSEGLTHHGIPFVSLPSLNKWSIPHIMRTLRRGGIDLVYSNDSQGGGRNACLAAHLVRVPSVCHVRALGWNKSWWGSWHLNRARAVIAVSEACAASVSRFVRPGRLHVVHNGVPVSDGRTLRERSVVMEELGLPKDGRLLLSAGHIYKRKGQRYALEAMPQILKRDPSAYLCLTGWVRDGDYMRELEELADELGLGSQVHFLGFRTDVEHLMGAADLLLHTATADPHPRAVLEAMAAGLPVVAFGVDGVTETVEDEKTGLLIAPGDVGGLASGVVRLLSDGALRSRLGEAGRRRVTVGFTDVRTAEGVRRVIAQVLGERQAGGAPRD